jgi:hypothetical protein
MTRKNLFDGDSDFAAFAQVSYKLLMTREWVTYKSVMDVCYPKDKLNSVSSGTAYGELKKAFPAVRKSIQEKLDTECFEEEGNNRNKRFRYIGNDDDPLADMRNAKVINDLRQYWKFCQDSAGFFPSSWLEYFFKHKQYDYKKLLLWAWLAPVIMGGVLELLQAYCTFGHRNGDWLDFAANATGCTLIGIIGFAVTAIRKK